MKGYKTVIFNVVMTVVMAWRLWFPETASELPTGETVQVVIDNIDKALIAGWGIGNLILRTITNTPIFKNKANG